MSSFCIYRYALFVSFLYASMIQIFDTIFPVFLYVCTCVLLVCSIMKNLTQLFVRKMECCTTVTLLLHVHN